MSKLKIKNPHVLNQLSERGYRVLTNNPALNTLVQNLLFDLGFKWFDGKQAINCLDAYGLAFEHSGIGFFPSLTGFDTSSRCPISLRAIQGLLFGQNVVAFNNCKNATHYRKDNNKLYLVTKEATYFWSTHNSIWMISEISQEVFNELICPFDDDDPDFNLTFEVINHKPKTHFDGVW